MKILEGSWDVLARRAFLGLAAVALLSTARLDFEPQRIDARDKAEALESWLAKAKSSISRLERVRSDLDRLKLENQAADAAVANRPFKSALRELRAADWYRIPLKSRQLLADQVKKQPKLRPSLDLAFALLRRQEELSSTIRLLEQFQDQQRKSAAAEELLGRVQRKARALDWLAAAAVAFVLLLGGAALRRCFKDLRPFRRRTAGRLSWALLPPLAATSVAAALHLCALSDYFDAVRHHYTYEPSGGWLLLFAVCALVWTALRLPERAPAAFAAEESPWRSFFERFWGRGFRRNQGLELPFFNDYLQAALKQGAPLPESLAVYAEQVRSLGLKRALAQVGADVARGAPLSKALESFPNEFPRSYVSLIKAGEAMGDIPPALKLASATLERNMELKFKIKAALLYPAVVGGIFLAVTMFLLVFVVPTFGNIFSSFGAALPLVTRMLISISRALTARPVYLTLPAAAFLAAERIYRNPALVPALTARLPYFGELARKEREARLCRLLGEMLQSGSSMGAALESCREDMEDAPTARGLETVEAGVNRGEKLSTAAERAGVFSREFVWACSLGEERENIPDSLAWLAEHDELFIRSRLEYLVPVAERSANIAMGLLVGFVVIALFAPMLGMGEIVWNSDAL